MAGGFGKWKDEGRDWTTPVTLTADQRNRYQRHLLLPEVGVEGQAKLLASKVLMLGAGGLGSPAALYLAAAGVGTIGIVDMDEVDVSNLQRQILHNIDRIGDRKVDSAKKTLTLVNPDVDVVTYDTRLSADNVMQLLEGYDVVIDGADNFPSRYLLNDASVKLGHPGRARLDLPLRGHGHRVRSRSGARTTATWCPSRRRPSWRRRARRPACSACCPASSARSRPSRPSSSCSTWAIRSSVASSATTRWSMSFRDYKLQVDPTNPVNYANRDNILIVEYEGLCAPHMAH